MWCVESALFSIASALPHVGGRHPNVSIRSHIYGSATYRSNRARVYIRCLYIPSNGHSVIRLVELLCADKTGRMF